MSVDKFNDFFFIFTKDVDEWAHNQYIVIQSDGEILKNKIYYELIDLKIINGHKGNLLNALIEILSKTITNNNLINGNFRLFLLHHCESQDENRRILTSNLERHLCDQYKLNIAKKDEKDVEFGTCNVFAYTCHGASDEHTYDSTEVFAGLHKNNISNHNTTLKNNLRISPKMKEILNLEKKLLSGDYTNFKDLKIDFT